MKYISYTFVDDATRIPVSVEPARKGPVMPEGVEYVFSLEDSFSTGVPSFFGTADDNFVVLDWMRDFSEESFIDIFKGELCNRASSKRQQLISQGFVEEAGVFFDYSKATLDGLYSVINAMLLDQDISEVDFKVGEFWIKLSLMQAREILVAINKKIQSLFSWNSDMHSQISESRNIESLVSIQNSISQYTGLENDS